VIGHCSNISKLCHMEQRLYNIRVGLMLFSIITSCKNKMWYQVPKTRTFLSVTVFGCVSYELNQKVDKETGGMCNTLKITPLRIFCGACIELHCHCYTQTYVVAIEPLRLACQKCVQKKVCVYVCVCVYIYIHVIHIYIYVCVCVYVCMYVCMHAFVYCTPLP
jgi:hypothetical protein